MTDSDPNAQLATELAEIRTLIAGLSAGDTSREDKAFDQLYEELRQYKEDFLFQSEKPLLLDLLLFYDSLNWFQESLVKQEMSPDVIADSFQFLLDEFLEVLYRRDVVPTEPRERFDMKTQRAVKAVTTSDESEHQLVDQVVKRGFTRGDKTLRPEEVIVKRYVAEK